MAVPTTLVDTTFSSKNLTTAVSVYEYTATADVTVRIQLRLTGVDGNGDYIAYLTLNDGDAQTDDAIGPRTTYPAASGETSFWFATMSIDLKNGDVINIMVKGLAGDNSESGSVRIFTDGYLQPTTAGRTLDVSATGEAGLDFDNVKDASGAHTLTNITVPVVTSVTNAVNANVTQLSGDSTAADNAEAFFDGTGYAGTNNVIPTVTSLTNPVDITSILARGTSPVAGAVNQITLDGSALAVAGSYVHNMIALVGGTGAGQARLITAYTAGRVATVVPNWDVIPANDTVYQVLPIGQSYLNACALDAIDATALAASAVTEIQTGLATSASIGTPVALDGGAATIAGMLTKMADDNGGADFDATTDSLEKISEEVATLAPGGAVVLNSEITEIHTT